MTIQFQKERIFGLDLIRALAILMVLISHTDHIFKNYDNHIIDILKVLGIQGVEVFFVLSGFLIGGQLLKIFNGKQVTFHQIQYFVIRRWFRTLPLYFLMLVVNISIALIVGYTLPGDIWKFFLFLQNFSGEHILFFPESWSLSIEEFSYIVAPIVLFGFYQILRKRKDVFLWGTLFLVFIFISTKIVFYLIDRPIENTLQFWNTNVKAIVIYRLDSIYYGFILAYFHVGFSGLIRKWRIKLVSLGIILAVTIYVVLPLFRIDFQTHPFYWNVLYLPLNSMAIGLILPWFYYLKCESVSLIKIVTKISKYSYAMYLVHYTFLLYIMSLLYPIEGLSFWSKIIYALVYFVFTYGISLLIFRFFENPLTNLRESKFIKDRFEI